MRILVVAATKMEVSGLCSHFKMTSERSVSLNDTIEIELIIPGIGMTKTAFALGSCLANNKYDLAIQLGIAGSFSSSLPIGSLADVVQDRFGDLGVEDNESFIDSYEMGLDDPNKNPFRNGWLVNNTSSQNLFPERIPRVQGLTVNKVHGNANSIEQIRRKYSPDIESMEGASFFYSCLMTDTPFCQVRSISNRVEPRNKELWDIPLAIKNLNDFGIAFLEKLIDENT